MATVKMHNNAILGGGEARQYMQQRRFADTARTANMQHDNRIAGAGKHPFKQGALGTTAYEALLLACGDAELALLAA